MQNEQGEKVDLYIPRKCSWSSRIIAPKDHQSVQLNIAKVDPVTGVATGEKSTIALSGYVRQRGDADMAINELFKKL